MKKHIIVKIVLCAFFVLSYARYGEAVSGPKEVLVKYLDAAFSNNNKTLYECISKEAREGQTLGEFLAKEPKEQNELENVFRDKVSYEVKDITIDRDTAKARVFVTVPDFKKMFAETAMQNVGMALKGTLEGTKTSEEAAEQMTGDAIIHDVIETFKDKDVPLKSADIVIEMVKEKGAWKIRYKRQKL